MSTGPEPTTAPPPAYNPDPAVTGYVPSASFTPASTSESTPGDPATDDLFTLVTSGLKLWILDFFWKLSAYNSDHKVDDPKWANFVYPPAKTGFAWKQVPTAGVDQRWWLNLPIPIMGHPETYFSAYSRSDMDQHVDVFSTADPTNPNYEKVTDFRIVTYTMQVMSVSADKKRLLVYVYPDGRQMWILGAQSWQTPTG